MSLPITTSRLIMRRPTAKDVTAILALEADPEVARETPEIGTTADTVTKYIEVQAGLEPFELDKCFDLFLELREDGSLIGLVSLVHRSPSRGQIGWALHGDYRGQGYAGEAGLALTRYAFETVGLHRVHADASIDNIGSWQVMERIGLKREGIQREATRVDGQWQDLTLYGITADDWQAP